MAEESNTNQEQVESVTEDMEIVDDTKRGREEEDNEEQDGNVAKKQKVEESMEEKRLEMVEKSTEGNGVESDEPVRISLGPKSFESSVKMFDYFYKLLHYWPPNVNLNKYEFMVLLDLIKKGHPEPEKKMGSGVQAFQVQIHPMWKSRCFFIIREDESVDDFSFRKCVDKILPLPENMKVKSDADKFLGGGKSHGGRGGRGRGRGRGRGGKSRN